MNVLITGAKGFIGKNLSLWLKNDGINVFEYDLGIEDSQLEKWISQSNFIVHLAGINRPLNPQEFLDGNVNFTKKLLDLIKKNHSSSPIIFASSTQAALNNPYGISKKMAEDEIFSFSKEEKHDVFVFRFYNVFGKWCRPNYNSVIATWCYNTTQNIPLQINEQAPAIDFVYIDDICREIEQIITKEVKSDLSIHYVEPHYQEKLSDVASLLTSFKESRSNFSIALQDGFEKKLYATYLSYLNPTDFAYPLLSHVDNRGSFTEILKTHQYGQISVNVAHPGIVKGNHYHMSKNEKYLVVSGTCEIKLRKIDSQDVIKYVCSSSSLRVVDIPPGYTHSIKNIGDSDSVTIMWANEEFDPKNPDTFMCDVELDK
jgi:UDP-2-acetamido-2,6-beta-L-arabino-hexul-4-ose reductase